MSHWQNLPNVERAFQALSGIAAGIALDYHGTACVQARQARDG
jgi:hypothetical protein